MPAKRKNQSNKRIYYVKDDKRTQKSTGLRSSFVVHTCFFDYFKSKGMYAPAAMFYSYLYDLAGKKGVLYTTRKNLYDSWLFTIPAEVLRYLNKFTEAGIIEWYYEGYSDGDRITVRTPIMIKPLLKPEDVYLPYMKRIQTFMFRAEIKTTFDNILLAYLKEARKQGIALIRIRELADDLGHRESYHASNDVRNAINRMKLPNLMHGNIPYLYTNIDITPNERNKYIVQRKYRENKKLTDVIMEEDRAESTMSAECPMPKSIAGMDTW